MVKFYNQVEILRTLPVFTGMTVRLMCLLVNPFTCQLINGFFVQWISVVVGMTRRLMCLLVYLLT